MAIHPVDAYIGRKLKIRRVELGISQCDLGRHTGVTFQQIQKYEVGLNRISGSRLYEFSKILKVPVYYFFEGYEEYSGISDKISKNVKNSKGNDLDDIENEIINIIRYYSLIKDANIKENMVNMLKNTIKIEKNIIELEKMMEEPLTTT